MNLDRSKSPCGIGWKEKDWYEAQQTRNEISRLLCFYYTHNGLRMYCGQVPCCIVDKILVCGNAEQRRSRQGDQDHAREQLHRADGPASA